MRFSDAAAFRADCWSGAAKPVISKTYFEGFSMLKRFVKDEGCAAMVEYGLLVGLIAVVCIVGIQQLGTNVNDVFCAINTAIANVPALVAVGAAPGC